MCLVCVRNSLVENGGGGTETVIGRIINADGTVAGRSEVLLLPSDYDPFAPGSAVKYGSLDTTSDSGSYTFSGLGPGIYTLTAVNLDTKTRALNAGIVVKNGIATMLVDTLYKPGTIKIALPPGVDTLNSYVYIPGTDIAVMTAAGADTIELDSVPSGNVPAVYYAVKGSTVKPQMLRDSVFVAPGETTIVTNATWKFLSKLFLNTTATGANVAGTVTNFPVLVRLNAGNFDFSQAQASGNDIRFTKSNGDPLFYEIERWDASNNQAEIWVKVDTIFGNDSTHFITMYWGNPNAESTSNSAAVFDTSDGFQGVWHLNEATGLPAKDATANHFDGTPSDTAPEVALGMLGAAKQFDGISNFFEMKNTASGKLDFPNSGTYSLSAWVWVDTLNNQSQMILTKGWLQYFIHIGALNSFEFNEYVDQTGWERTWTPAVEQEWHFVTGVRSGSTEYLFVDGVCVDSTPGMGYFSTDPRTTTDNLSIGRNPAAPWNFFKGKIDEARIMDKAPTAAWIKLCYMNQRQDDQLVEFR
jgi:hypothetical protein